MYWRGKPFCTSAPQVVSELLFCAFEDPVAPPQPSLPVFPPNNITLSPGIGLVLTTFL